MKESGIHKYAVLSIAEYQLLLDFSDFESIDQTDYLRAVKLCSK
jgi:hypothetical protein